MKVLVSYLFIILSLFLFVELLQAQEIEATLGGSTESQGFSVIDVNEGTTLFRVRGDGNVGIGTTSPSATLQVEGSTKIGTNADAVAITDIVELTGTTNSSGSTTVISYPTGWDENNTRVLSYEIYNNNSFWCGQAHTSSDGGMQYVLTDNIRMNYPITPSYQNVPYRLMIMKIN